MNPSYIPFAVIAAALLVYVFERLRESIPPKVVSDYKDLAQDMKGMIPAELLPFITSIAASAMPVAQRIEKTAIAETKALLRAYAEQTDSPIDDSFCKWLDELENKEK